MTTSNHVDAVTDVFDRVHDALADGDVHAAMGRLRLSLDELRTELPSDGWAMVCRQARSHALHGLLLESPFTRRAYEKPRGYAGDAVLMDLIYGMTAPGGDLSPLGGMLFGYEFDSPCFLSVRTRRAIIAREIDNVAATRPTPRVLSIASGHLREIEWSRTARAGTVAITALDQDRESLECIERHYRHYGVSTISATIGDLLRRSVHLPAFDLVYAAGLYDYLEHDLARALTTTLFGLLAPGGWLTIANFTPETHDAGVMEAVMDWQLVYRTPEDVCALAAKIAPADVAAIEQFSDDNRHVTYMRVVKR